MLAIGDTTFVILLGSVILGMAMGNLLMFHPLLLAEAFGVKDYARIYGMGSLLMIFGVGSGPFLVGFIRDVSSYRSAFAVITVFAIAGLAFLAAAGKPPSVQSSGDKREANVRSQQHVQQQGQAARTLIPADQIEQPSIATRRRVAVIDRGAAMGEDRLGMSESAAIAIPHKGSD
ncbi:MAG TPA: hypothetical protein DCX77_05495 [Acidimicrobiaceae bacterium]|nr:hypothetical protein [Acidimicrobiaceae bacterium]